MYVWFYAVHDDNIMYMNTCVGCSEYTIIPARYAYLLNSDITDSQAAVLERKNYMLYSNTSVVTYKHVKCVLYFVAFGVAHQALEEIEPSEETVLIIGD